MKKTLFNQRGQQRVLALLLPLFAMNGGPVRANPAGPDVVAGNVNFQGLGTPQLDINNLTNGGNGRAIINWQSFSIDAGEVTRINQGAGGFTLNRVTGGNASAIYGRLEAAQGGVAVINPNGILVGPGGVVDVGGLTMLSTLGVDNADFLSGGATSRFYGDTATGVTNFGTISSNAGDVVLMGGFVDNQGQIGALNGTVAIGAGGDILLHEGGGSKISVRGSSDYTGTGINNEGAIEGASVELKSHGNVYALAINNGGTIRANGATRSGGRVLLRASGGSSNIQLGSSSTIAATDSNAGGVVEANIGGLVEIDAGQGQGRAEIGGSVTAGGTAGGGRIAIAGREVEQSADGLIDASGAQAGGIVEIDAAETLALRGQVKAESSSGTGGEIAATARTLIIHDGAGLSADGFSAGGRIRAGGDFQGRDTDLVREADGVRVGRGARLSADSLAGDAGTVIVWANVDTLFLGEVSASALGGTGDGGFVEVSGRERLYFDGDARVATVGGKVGTVLFDPGDIVIGATGTTPPLLIGPVEDNLISIASINNTLQSGADVIVFTASGGIIVQDIGGGGVELGGATANDRHAAIQWTNSLSSFGAFASGSIFVNNHIRTSGAGSINLLAGWSPDATGTSLPPQALWDHYVKEGLFGMNGGSVVIGNSTMIRHVEVGSRFGDTNVAGYDVRVIGSDTNSVLRYSMIGWHDGGQAFGPRVNKGGLYRLDLKAGDPAGTGQWYLSDGLNAAGQAANGVGDPIVGIVGWYEVDINGDGIVDGVHGINSTGVLTDTFIPYANHYNSALGGNWWWQQIEAADPNHANAPAWATSSVGYMKDPLGLGGLRPEYGAGVGEHSTVAQALVAAYNADPLTLVPVQVDKADINVVARGNVLLLGGAGNEETGASIGHGGPNRGNWGGGGTSVREIGHESVNDARFSITTDAANPNQIIEGGQIERRWSFNGSNADRNATAIGRLAPVYGNINVLAGVSGGAEVDHAAGTVAPTTFSNAGNVILRATQTFDTGGPASNSTVQIGHGGVGQFGEFYGDIHVEAGGSVILESGEATRAAVSIGHSFVGHTYWNPPSNVDQQIRFFATTGDFDNPNLRRGELFSGAITTGFNPDADPARFLRYTLGDGYAYQSAGAWIFVGHTDSGNFVRVATDSTGTDFTGKYVNFNNVGGNGTERVINMSPLLYSQGIATEAIHIGAGNAASQGRTTLAPLTLAPVSTAATPIVIESLDGSVITGFHGDINVIARSGDVTLRGYNTVGTGTASRDTRFAMIGHGGRGFEADILGSGYRGIQTGPAIPGMSGGSINAGANPAGRERVNYGIANGTEYDTASLSERGASTFNRNGMLYMSITGDINVEAGRDVTLIGGNDVYAFTQIGHGGFRVADYETASLILGDIRVVAGRDVTLTGGGAIPSLMRSGNYTPMNWARIGHGGFQPGYYGFFGDILVKAGRDITLTNGAYRYDVAQIGHQGVEAYGQTGGDFIRNEHFTSDGVAGTIRTILNDSEAKVVYSAVTPADLAAGAVEGERDFYASGAGTLITVAEGGGGSDRRTTNITVEAVRDVTLNHMQEGIRQPEGRNGGVGDPDNQDTGILTRDSFAMIGHGGIATQAVSANNTSTNYSAKIGDISVSTLGSINLENGTGMHRWTRIGHGIGASNRVDDNTNNGAARAIRLVGNITVEAGGDILVNADAADENERRENSDETYNSNPSSRNPVAIGHGGIYDNNDLVVLGRGELVNGFAASSDITVKADGDLSVLGGKGVEASYAQIGHGFASDVGNDNSRLLGIPTGFAGDIDVEVGGNLLVKGNDNAWSQQPFDRENTGRTVTGAFGAIGHGGYQLDAPSYGDIRVYVGNDAALVAQQRIDPFTDDSGPSPYTLINQETDAIASAFNFAKIGHFSVENGNRSIGGSPTFTPDRNDEVRDANQTGDITVVVGRDLRMEGGTTGDVDTMTIYGAFVQIGHGGPSIAGDLEGEITVLVGGDATITQGSERGPGDTTTKALNNYAMIGHGDRLYDVSDTPSSLFNATGGFRDGDIVLAAGRHATIRGALVGHVDPMLGSANFPAFGDTRVAVSRTNPFYGGTGNLTSIRHNNLDAAFSSGNGGVGTQLEFYMPARSNNQMAATTRVNEKTANFTTAPANFTGLDTSAGILAGRDDEVYLTPDLWWDQAGLAAANNFPGGGSLPGDASSGQGGALAIVDAPGGMPNLAALIAGELGDSAPVYRDANGVSGAGLYTLYYDAIRPVANTFPPQLPGGGAGGGGFFPGGDYDAFFRWEDLFGGVGGEGDELYGLLGLFERDETTEERSGAWRVENGLDDLFGPRRDSTASEEDDEDKRHRRDRAKKGRPLGLSYYVFDPGTNRYSSYRVFGNQSTTFYPAN